MKLQMIPKNMRPRPTAFLALAAGISLSLTSCGDKQSLPEETGGGEDGGKKATPPKTETAASVAATPAVTGTTRSQHFAAVAPHLDLGGIMFGYLDVDGDVEKIAEMLQGFLDVAEEQAGEDMPPHIKALDLSKVLGDLGLDGIEAIGLSSYKDGELYRNKAYVHIPAGRKGLLKLVGGDAKPFVAKQLAPKDADLIMEQSLDARAGFEVVSSMVAQIGGPDASRDFMAAVTKAMPELGLSMADLFRKLDTRITVIGRIHPDKPLEIPDAPLEIPSFDLLVSFDDLGWLYGKVTGQMKKEMPAEQQTQLFTKGEGFERMSLPPMPDPEMAIVQPVVHHDIAGKRVLIASSQAFLEECLAGSSNLSENADFTAATQGLPTEGNSLNYISASLMNEYRKLISGMMQINEGAEADGQPLSPMQVQRTAMTAMMNGLLPEAKGSQASVMVNTPEGILMASNSTSSPKEGVLMGGVAGIAMVAAITVPALNKAQSRAKEARSEAMLRQMELQDQINQLDRAPDEGAPPPAPVPQQP